MPKRAERAPTERDKAIHEAGHAVIAHVLGERAACVTLLRGYDAPASAHTTSAAYRARGESIETRLKAFEVDMLVCLAGPAADSKHRPSENKRKRSEWEADLQQASKIAVTSVALTTNGSLPEGPCRVVVDSRRVEELLQQATTKSEALVAEHWEAIMRVAEELLVRKILSSDEVDALIAGRPTDAQVRERLNW